MREGRISGDELKVLLVICDEVASFERPFVELRNEEWARRAGMNERSMRRVRKRLLDDESGRAYLLRRVNPDDQRTFLYALREPQWWTEVQKSREEIKRIATP